MTVLIDRIGQTGVDCLIWVGRVSKSEALALPDRVDPAQPQFGYRWISYFDSTADLSELDAPCLLALRDRLRPIVAVLAAKGPFRMILATNSRYNDPLLAVWQAIATLDADYPSNPTIERDIPSAARALGLSAAEAEDARLWIESRVAEASRDST